MYASCNADAAACVPAAAPTGHGYELTSACRRDGLVRIQILEDAGKRLVVIGLGKVCGVGLRRGR